MQAVQVTEFGAAEVLKAVELPAPEAGPQDILIRVEASGVNYADAYFRMGAFPGLPVPPFVPGMEGAGRVISAPPGGLVPGQRVAFSTHGTYAEQVVVPAEGGEPWQIAVPVPEALPLEHAAGLMMSGRTAWLLARQAAGIAAGQAVLVHAAAGGVGWVLCQLLKAAGLRVVALAGGSSKAAVLRPLGLDAVVDRGSPDAETRIAAFAPDGYAAVFNASGGESVAGSLDLLGQNGRLIWYGFAAGAEAPGLEAAVTRNFMKSVCLTAFNGGASGRAGNEEAVAALAEMFLAGTLLPPPSKGFALAEAAQAHVQLQDPARSGKLFLRM